MRATGEVISVLFAQSESPHVYGVDEKGNVFDCGEAEAMIANFHIDFEDRHYFFAYPALLPLDGPPKLMVYYPHQDKLLEWPYGEYNACIQTLNRGVGKTAPIFFYMED